MGSWIALSLLKETYNRWTNIVCISKIPTIFDNVSKLNKNRYFFNGRNKLNNIMERLTTKI